MKYLIVSVTGEDGERYARTLSTLVFNIIRPISVKDPKDTTTELYPWIKHWQTGEVAIVIPDLSKDRQIYIHEESDIESILQVLRIELLEGEAQKLINDVNNNKGKTIDIASVLPASLFKQIKTEDEMRNEGWFYDPNLGT